LRTFAENNPQLVLICAFQHDFYGVRNFCLDVVGERHNDGMAKTKLHVELHSTHSFALSPRVCFERGTISNTDEVQGHGEAFCHAGDRVLDESASETPHGPLLLDLGILNIESQRSYNGKVEGHVRLEGDGRPAERAIAERARWASSRKKQRVEIELEFCRY
jgi:hypothetical protein